MAFTFFEDCTASADKMSDQIVSFLSDNPETFVWRGKNKPDPTSVAGQSIIKPKMVEAFTTFQLPSETKTVPDPAVAQILAAFYDVQEVDRAVNEHRKSMGAENFVGYILEVYILSEGFKYGWCLCPNSVVKSVDFVKQKQDGSWIALQVKNRDNSENSSSKAIRQGTDIRHWFRTFSRKPKTNWTNFPDESLKKVLSEEGFFKFIENYLNNHPKVT